MSKSQSNRVFNVTVKSFDPTSKGKAFYGTAIVEISAKGVKARQTEVNLSPLAKSNFTKNPDKYIGKIFKSTVDSSNYQDNPFKIISFFNKIEDRKELINRRLEMVFEGKPQIVVDNVMGIISKRKIFTYLKPKSYRRFVDVVLQ